MASNFDFLPEDTNWCKDVRRAERRIYSDPASACAKARRALEFIVGEVYERELDADAQGDLFADVDARPFQRWMQRRDADLYDAFHHIRQSGNQGAHHQKEGDVEPKEALATVRSLKQAVWWYVQRYASAYAANGDPSFEPPVPEDQAPADGGPSHARRAQNTVEKKRVRALERSSARQLAQLIKKPSTPSAEVEIATAILLNRIREANDELIATVL